ncbi:hypothetical protein JJL45_02215 [Tamlana sp. s12]|uniref:PID-CTERM protein-sorting domain-containing protein n=1 Tax=Tamlana sp. s12 TaxID=1630406 RepID=UPI000800EDC5|nr:hypothetical protein [Tamlana sp. s12]OBQ56995.1 hypothetical protein VQ01_00455 [Tamlana sp. s12]QQY82829.1 hypothetical protein JJL45_02215 [Tamlana sp. s12]
MKNKKKSVFGLINVFAILLVFSITTNTHAATSTSSSPLPESNLSALTLSITPVALTTVIGDRDKGPWAKSSSKDNGKKNRFDKGGDRDQGSKNRNGCSHKRGCKCGGDNPAPPTDDIPLDGGLSLLALGAAAFGIRKLRGNKNAKA